MPCSIFSFILCNALPNIYNLRLYPRKTKGKLWISTFQPVLTVWLKIIVKIFLIFFLHTHSGYTKAEKLRFVTCQNSILMFAVELSMEKRMSKCWTWIWVFLLLKSYSWFFATKDVRLPHNFFNFLTSDGQVWIYIVNYFLAIKKWRFSVSVK